MTYTTLLYDLTGGVATLTLNRPEVLNAFNDEMAAEALTAVKTAERDPAVRCLVLTGAGKGFCAGQDLQALRARAAAGSFRAHLERTYNPLISRLRALEKPVIAQINGPAAGAGLGLALACDLRYAAAGAKLRLAFSGIGLAPDSGTSFFLPRLIGPARAFELAATNAPLTAERALAWGLVNGVYPAEELAAAVRAVAEQLAAAPTKALGLTKRAFNQAAHLTLDEALAYEAQLQEIAGRTADYHEGVAAFLAKRPPAFRGE
ncbi:MAG: enoyl-CoA hydratase/isomerase family protein [Anaerolineales bacterium]|nr:enoyl-CoA hydratase/isomerase family protein [Anaerolineales bacterium]